MTYKVWSKRSEVDFFTRLWVHFGTPLFAEWCPRTPSLPGTMVGPSVPLSSLWASVEESCVPVPCYCLCRAGCRKSKSSACASSFVWNWEEMVQRHLKCWELPSVSNVWAVFAFSNGTRFKEGRDSVDDSPQSGRVTTSKTQLCCASARTDLGKSALNNPWTLCRGWIALRNLPGHTDARFEHAACCCKICSTNSHHRTEGMVLVCANKYAAGSRVRWKLYGANHHGRRDVGLRVWPGDEMSVFAMEVCWFPEAKESAPGAVKSESHAHCFLWYGGHCSLWVCSTRPNCKPTVLSTSFEVSEAYCFSQEATETGGGGLGTTSWQCTQHIPSRCFWQVMAFLSFSNHPSPLTWLRVTSGYSPN